MIFVQIAAYRDPELLPTIQDCLATAKYPNDLRFGICWQTDLDDQSISEFQDDKRFRIEKVHWVESQGLGWARSKIQKLYQGETYTLQLDSHHRFAKHWDEFLIESLAACASPKPIITTYAGMYDPKRNVKIQEAPSKMVAEKFTSYGTILFRPQHIQNWQDFDKPIPARFVSGHYFFTLGSHCEEYQYDPDIYFAGDEISLSIRSYTMGYDIYHPHRNVVWHEYTRSGRTKHWDDHITNAVPQGVTTEWWKRDSLSKKRLRKLLHEEDNDEILGKYGLGNIRTHEDYMRYAGIDFAGRRLQRDTLAGINPPNAYVDDSGWESGFMKHHRLTLQWKGEDVAQCDDLKFLYIGVEDAQGNVIYRYDASPDSVEAQPCDGKKVVEFQAEREPSLLVLWPVSQANGWLKKVVYKL